MQQYNFNNGIVIMKNPFSLHTIECISIDLIPSIEEILKVEVEVYGNNILHNTTK